MIATLLSGWMPFASMNSADRRSELFWKTISQKLGSCEFIIYYFCTLLVLTGEISELCLAAVTSCSNGKIGGELFAVET